MSRPKRIEFLERVTDFMDIVGLAKQDVLTIIRNWQRTERDPHSAEVGYPIQRYISGDVTVVVGFKDPEIPTVLHVWVRNPDEPTGKGTKAAGSGGGVATPANARELIRKAQALGYEVRYSKHAELWKNGKPVTAIHMGASNSDRNSNKNAWLQILRYEKEHG